MLLNGAYRNFLPTSTPVREVMNGLHTTRVAYHVRVDAQHPRVVLVDSGASMQDISDPTSTERQHAREHGTQ